MSDNTLPAQSDALAGQAARNLESRDAWDRFAPHRAIVTDHLLRAGDAGRSKSLCLLGAGNANDVDLGKLLDCYGSIDLVDCDADALRAAVARQQVSGDARVRGHGGVDLASAAAALPRDDYHVVASLCMLSQLIDRAVRTLPDDSEQLLATVHGVRRRHLQLALDHLRAGGLLVLVTDFVSSDTCPELLTIDDRLLAEAANRWIQQWNFFTGLNPHALQQLLLADESIAPRIAEAQLVRPWRWRLSARRAYAVCALKAIKR